MRTIPALASAFVLLLAPDAFAATAAVRTYAPYPSLTRVGLFYAATPGERNRVVAAPDLATPFPYDILLRDTGADVLDGGDGRDRLYGGTGRDTLRGGDGDDELAAGGPGAVLDGGPGSDLLSARHPRILRCGRGNDMVARPRGLLLAGCESVRVGRFVPAYYDTATVSVQPRRVRGGGVGVAWSCEATANRCDLRVTVRAGSTMLGRRSAVLFKRDAKGEIVIGRRRSVRRGQLLDVSIVGAIYESDYKDGRTQRFTASWRVRL